MSARPTRSISSTASSTKNLFRDILARGNGGKKWKFTHSGLFLDFLAGNQTYECTPWSMPLRTVFGWQKPCYLLGEGYAKTFKELMEGTDWEKYGVGKYEKCANCMVALRLRRHGRDRRRLNNPHQGDVGGDARREDHRPDGAGYRPLQAAPGASTSSRAMSRRSSSEIRTRRSPRCPAESFDSRVRSANALVEIDAGRDQRAERAAARAPPPPSTLRSSMLAVRLDRRLSASAGSDAVGRNR